MNKEKMKEVFSDEAFVTSLFELETAAEVRSALQKKGVELTEEEIIAIRKLLGKLESGEITKEQLAVWQQQAEDGELSEEALEQVSGGSFGAIVDALNSLFEMLQAFGAKKPSSEGRGRSFRW